MKNVFKIVALLSVSLPISARAQSAIVTFESTLRSHMYKNYYEQGMWFQVTPPATPYSDYIISIDEGHYIGMPYNGTKYIYFTTPYLDYISISLTNGGLFGLSSVDLSTKASAFTPLNITFNGFHADGSMVTTTFTTPGDGASTFLTYTFGTEFSSGLTRVEIPTSGWAMDNLVIVPEPGTTSLLALGCLAFAGWAKRKRHKSPTAKVT